jgi:hypothetical protein
LTARRPRILLVALPVIALVVVAALGFALAESEALAPLRLLPRYPWSMLAAEAVIMDECVECHLPADMHTCDTCHDEHGSAELINMPFNALILLTGDVPEASYIPVQEIVPVRDGRRTHTALLDLLAQYGVTEFESVTLASADAGLVTIERQYLTEEALLLPHVESVRFADENLHVSTWLKGITRIIIVGAETPITINGQATSIGRLLVGPQLSVTVEQTDVLLKSEIDGQVRRGKTAFRLDGAPLTGLVGTDFRTLVVRDEAGHEHRLTAEEVRGAVVSLVRGKATLVLPERGRSEWVSGVVEIESEA